MKNKTLIILLVIPFIISLLTFASVQILENVVPADIIDIAWNYGEQEGFKLSNQLYPLEAKPIINENLVNDNRAKELIWSIKKVNKTDPECLEVVKDNDNYFLKTIQEGQAKVVVSNKRGSIAKSFLATVYEDGAIIINNKTYPTSGTSVTGIRYFGEYDLSYNSLKLDTFTTTKPTFSLSVDALGAENNALTFKTSENIVMDNAYNVTILKEGRASILFSTFVDGKEVNGLYNFDVIDNGYNIYSYNDLMMATNFSSNGLIPVLQKNLLSLSQIYTYDEVTKKYYNAKLESAKNAELFGNFDFGKQTFSFEKELYSTESTYNTEFIKQYNKEKSEKFSTEIKVGIRLQQNLYGNGFTINAHGLAYPNHGTYPASHKGRLVPTVGKDYFFGPLAYVTIGAIDPLPVVKAFGQDNVGLYIDGDNIKVDDLKIRNTDEVSNMINLHYTGSVIDVNGKDVTISNSIISNGRTAIRAFSADGLNITNCILKNANEFLLKLGNNEINKPDHTKLVSQTNGSSYANYEFDTFMNTEEQPVNANKVLNDFVDMGTGGSDEVIKTTTYNLRAIQDALDNTKGIINDDGTVNYGSEVTISKTYFNNSGLFSIAFDSSFNGAYLYKGLPSTINNYADLFSSVTPNELGGTSLPVKLNIDKTTKFYDWKNINKIDASTLIEENISAMLSDISGKEVEIDIDDFFPMKSILINNARKLGYIYKDENIEYINSKIAFYGGGLNLSTINMSNEDKLTLQLDNPIEVDILNLLLTDKTGSIATSNVLFQAFRKAVTLATGFHPFTFYTNGVVGSNTPTDYGKIPQVEDLYNNLEA